MSKRKETLDENSQNKRTKNDSLEIYFDQNIYRKKVKRKVEREEILENLKTNFSQKCNIIEQNNPIPNTILFKMNNNFLTKVIYIQPSSEKFVKENSTMVAYFTSIKHQLVKYINENTQNEEISKIDFFLILESFNMQYCKVLTELSKKCREDKTYRPNFAPKKTLQVITELQINLDINTRETQNSEETSDFLNTFVLNLFTNEKKMTILDFQTTKTDSSKDPSETFKNGLLQLGIPEIKVNAIVNKYPTFKSLTDEYYFSNKTEKEKLSLLTNIEVIYPIGQNRINEEKKKLGKSISEKIYNYFKEE
eukprot:gene1174-10688_t